MDEETPRRSAPLVSVVMCTYNGLPYLKEAISSVVNQSYPNWELVIADDGSTDGSREWLAEVSSGDERIKLYLHERNMGYVKNKNFVHGMSTGELITQLDQDDTCDPERLALQVRAFNDNPGAKIVGSGFNRIDTNGEIFQRNSETVDHFIYKKPQGGYPFWFPGLMVHRSVFERIGFFSTYFSGALGDDLYWTVKANQQYPIYYLSKPLYNYRDNPSSITNDSRNVRKLIMPAVLNELFDQIDKRGGDWIADGDFSSAMDFEHRLMSNGHFMSEQYRVWAASAIDKLQFKAAIKLLLKSVKRDRLNVKVLNTLFYGLRKFTSVVTANSLTTRKAPRFTKRP